VADLFEGYVAALKSAGKPLPLGQYRRRDGGFSTRLLEASVARRCAGFSA
jgi:hypothetical protein